MATQTLHTLATGFQAIGQLGPFTVDAGALKVDPQGWLLELTNSTDWPANGQPVCTLMIEQAPNGVNHEHDLTFTLAGAAWPKNSATATVHGGWSDGLSRAARLTVTMLQACTLGLVWKAL